MVLCSTAIIAQEPESDICVLEHLTAKSLRGTVVSVRLDNELEKSLARAVVELRHNGQQMGIAKTITDSNGQFSMPDVPTGKYSFAATPPASYRVALFSTAVDLRFSNAKREKQTKDYSGARLVV